MVKKGLIIAGISFAVLLGTLVLVPVLFRDALLEKTKSTISSNLNVQVGFDGFSLSLLRNFPRASLSVTDVLVTGKGSFEGDTLLRIPALTTRFGLFDLLTPGNLTIQELILERPELRLRVNPAEKANWDILPEESPGTTPDEKEHESTFGLEVSKIEINKGYISYTDQAAPLFLDLSDLELRLKGNLYGSQTRLKAEGSAAAFNLTYDSATYISKVRLDLESLLDIHFDTWLFTFGESELLVNDLPVDLRGSFSMPGDSLLFDLGFNAKASSFSDYLTLVPPGYQQYLEALKAEGRAELKGSFKGIYYEEEYPAFDLGFRVSEGQIRYAGLPEEIRNISGHISILKPQGGMDLTAIDISGVHAEVRNNPLNLSLRLDNLFGNIRFAGNLTGRVNFDHLRDAIPMDSVLISGLLDANIDLAGNMAAIENKQYEQIKTDGTVELSGFSFESNQLSRPVTVSTGRMDFAPEKVNLQHMDLKIGQSQLSVAGFVTDYYPYLFARETLHGNITLDADYLNLNELMALTMDPGTSHSPKETKTRTAAHDTLKAAPEPFEVPERVNLSLMTDIRKALYDKLTISNIKGQVIVSDGQLDLRGVTMNLFDGEMKLAGTYKNTPLKKPEVNVAVDLVSFDIPTAFQSLKLVRNYLPIAAQSKGKFSTSLRLNGQLDEEMGLVMESLNGSGLFNSMNVQVLNSPVFNKVKSVLNEERLRDLKIDDFAASFTIENGNLLLKPFKTKISGQEATFSGKLNASNLIDMDINFLVSRDALSKNIENTLGVLPGQKNIQIIPVGVSISGPVKNPDVKVDLSDARKMIQKEVGNATKEEIRQSVNKIGEGLKKLFK